MTRPTENQLAEALELIAAQSSGIVGSTSRADCMAAVAHAALRAYRSAQQAEVGAQSSAAGDDEALSKAKALIAFLNGEAALDGLQFGERDGPAAFWWRKYMPSLKRLLLDHSAAFERGRQQGMEQARAGVPCTNDGERCSTYVECAATACKRAFAASSAKPSNPSAQSSEAGLLDKAAASSAQEPLNSDTLWDLAKDECRASECGHQRFGHGMHFPDRAALLRFAALVIDRTDAERAASPARLAGAAQGEAVAWQYKNHRGSTFLTELDPSRWHPHDLEGFSDFQPLTYLHPQAQVGRKPLSSDEILKLPEVAGLCLTPAGEQRMLKAAREILAAHGIPTTSTASDEGSV